MTEAERDRERLQYILASISLIERYTQNGRDIFLAEVMVQDAVLRRLETLADATNRLSDTLKLRHPEIPWRRVYGLRNIAAHAYEDLELPRVWEVVDAYLPGLKAVVAEEIGRFID